MIEKKLAIIGASYLQLPLVKRAKELGIETHCFAWKDGAVCESLSDYFYPISVLEKGNIMEVCREKKVNGIVTIATDMVVPTISYVAEKLGLISNTFQSALISTNKGLMREAFIRNNVKSPKHIILNHAVENLPGYSLPVIVKPIDRSGSRGVCKIDNWKDLYSAISYAINESFQKQAIAEEFIDGAEVSVESISWEGQHYVLAVTDKITSGSPYFVELSHHQPSQLDRHILENIKSETIKALDALEIKYGAAHAEFKINTKGEVYVIEVGARMGGDFIGSNLVQLSTGYDYLKAVIEIALNQFVPPVITNRAYAGVYFLCEETKHLTKYFLSDFDFIVEKQMTNSEIRTIKNSNDRSGYFIYESSGKLNI